MNEAQQITRVHLMRHGEVDNPAGVLYERLPDYHLSERGRKMADMTGQWFKDQNRDLTVLWTSPLERVQETAAEVQKYFPHLERHNDDRLLEAGSHLAGRNLHKEWKEFLSPAGLKLFVNPLRPSWGEPYREMCQRMHAVISAARAAAYGHEALLVTHQLPIWVVRRWVEGKPLWHDPRQRECALASVTTLHFVGATLVGWEYASPAASEVALAKDIAPGTSGSALA